MRHPIFRLSCAVFSLLAVCLPASAQLHIGIPWLDGWKPWGPGRGIPVFEFRFDDVVVGLSVPDDPSAKSSAEDRRETELHLFEPGFEEMLAEGVDEHALTLTPTVLAWSGTTPKLPAHWTGRPLKGHNARTFRMAATPEVLITDRAAGRHVFLLESRSVKGERLHHYAVFQLGGAAPLTIDWFVDWHTVQAAYAGRSDRIGLDGATSARWEVRPAGDGRLWPMAEAKGYRLVPEYR